VCFLEATFSLLLKNTKTLAPFHPFPYIHYFLSLKKAFISSMRPWQALVLLPILQICPGMALSD
jgi:hypothetical protein